MPFYRIHPILFFLHTYFFPTKKLVQAFYQAGDVRRGASAGAFLRLADAHGCFQESVVALKQDVAEALAAVRRRDGARLASAVRAQRRAGKELARLAVAARECAGIGRAHV